jgi:hypothetical protein
VTPTVATVSAAFRGDTTALEERKAQESRRAHPEIIAWSRSGRASGLLQKNYYHTSIWGIVQLVVALLEEQPILAVTCAK